MTILVTGGAGYIGSHTVLKLLATGADVVVADNFDNSSPVVLERLAELAGRPVPFEQIDVSDAEAVDRVVRTYRVDGVIHFAGLKAVGESVAEPLRYYAHNLGSTITLLRVLAERGVRRFVFSSSATVYGADAASPMVEELPTSATNPYGWTKVMLEQVLRDVAASDPTWRIAILRYFNPVGAHPSGRIGEDPQGHPNNLLPYVAQVAVGRQEYKLGPKGEGVKPGPTRIEPKSGRPLLGIKSLAWLKCFYTNACSMDNKQEELEAIVHHDCYDVVAIMETWWDDSHD